MEETITITKEEYLSLLVSNEILCRLDGGGVDNWEWYSESLNSDGGIDLEEFEEIERERISKL